MLHLAYLVLYPTSPHGWQFEMAIVEWYMCSSMDFSRIFTVLVAGADAQGADQGGLQGQALELGLAAAGPGGADRHRGACQHLLEDR